MTGKFSQLFLLLFLLANTAWAAMEQTGAFVVIEKVDLKNEQGNWITVVEPDHLVNLDSEEAGASFFNQGKVVEGNYVNFRVTAVEARKPRSEAHQIAMQLKEDLSEPLNIWRRSFIGVWFKYSTKEATVTVDQSTQHWKPDEIQISEHF